jgi:hypothetical protein
MDQSHRIWQSSGSAAHVARLVEPPVGAGSIAGLPVRNQVALDLSWLFLQPNNSQCSNCQIRNTRTSNAFVIPMLEIPAKRQAGPSKPNVVTCSTCFIRSRSGSVSCAELDESDNSPTIGHWLTR